MERMLLVMTENPAAAIAGLAAMVCLATWPLFRTRPAMLGTYVGNNLGFMAHYGLLREWTAVAMNGLMSIQTVVALGLVRWPGLRWAYYALMPLLAGASLLTWQGLPSLLSAVATTLSTIGRMQKNDIVLRLLLLSSTPVWAMHDLIIGSLPGLAADVLSLSTGAAMLLRSPKIWTAVTNAVQTASRRAASLVPLSRLLG